MQTIVRVGQLCSSVVPGAMALLNRWLNAPAQGNTSSGSAPASPRGQDVVVTQRLINSQLDSGCLRTAPSDSTVAKLAKQSIKISAAPAGFVAVTTAIRRSGKNASRHPKLGGKLTLFAGNVFQCLGNKRLAIGRLKNTCASKIPCGRRAKRSTPDRAIGRAMPASLATIDAKNAENSNQHREDQVIAHRRNSASRPGKRLR